MINRYATFVRDIEPLGFDLAVMDGYLSKKTVSSVNELLKPSRRRKKMVDTNYRIAAQHYSYSVLRNQLTSILRLFFGDDVASLIARHPSPQNEGYQYIDPQVVMYKRYDSNDCRLEA